MKLKRYFIALNKHYSSHINLLKPNYIVDTFLQILTSLTFSKARIVQIKHINFPEQLLFMQDIACSMTIFMSFVYCIKTIPNPV